MSEPDTEHIAYAAWGERFFEYAVTEERVLAGVNVLAGRPIDVGPLGVGPGRIAKVTAKGSIGTATGQRVGDLPVHYAVVLPVQIEFVVDLGVDKHRFDAAIQVPLGLTAHARPDLSIEIVVTPPRSREILVELDAKGLRASLVGRAAGVETELRRFVAKYVAREVEKPHIAAARVIDVRTALDRAAGSVVPREDSRTVAADLPDALGDEIEQAAEQFLDGAS